MRYLLFILAVALGINDDGSREGRKGNEMYKNQKHAEAARWFGEGLQSSEEAKPGPVQAGLWNNLGATLHKMGQFEQATQAFSNAVALASSDREVARSAYNAGNNAYKAASNSAQASAPNAPPVQGQPQSAESMEAALDHYKKAMLADPTDENAKFNYEFVKRQMEEQEQNQDQQQQDQENQDQQNQDEQQQNQDQQNQEQQQEEQQQQQQNQQQQQQDQQQEQQQQQTPEDLDKLSPEEAERILQALQNEEEELLRQIVKPKTQPKKVDKDW